MPQTLTIETDARGVATLTLNRPEKHNALSAQMIGELTEAAGALGVDADVRVVVLTGAGASFCAGGDLGWMRDQMHMDAATRSAQARSLADMLGALNSLPKPLIGAVQGNAFGGGVGMTCVCDVAIGVAGAKLGLTETRLGLIPATIGPYVLARMGEGRARRVFMSARLFGAEQAVDLGILARCVAPEALAEAVEAEVVPYLSCAPGAVAAAKKLARDLGPRIDGQVVDHTIAALAACWESDEAAEGIDAFFSKRKAAWVRR
ncbi:crotonase/enoyl-CoA hydratase family protein [uncultured Roseobacter sp.]|uniref:crotonase/enoyl-CoA hydratase family protein n=1 Tax=uncultured Roseobacter sp. TaxID=114847 RepID=UPI0026098165|nr:crotonase/enoyl-CoA hydratase family protein [uncultured Roseobacter sp.]